MKTQNNRTFYFLMFFMLATSCCFSLWSQSLNLDKNSFLPGEDIRVHFTASPNYAETAWIGIIPANIPHGSEATNDQHDLTYQYLKKMSSGTFIFKAPATLGTYDFRMHDTDSNGKEVAFVTFTVAVQGDAELRLEQTSFRPGEPIKLLFTAPSGLPENAWIGIIPSGIPHGSEATNDQNDIAYQYLGKKTSGELTFSAPTAPGSWDFRMNDSDTNGKELASITFTVGAVGDDVLMLDKTTFRAGEDINVQFNIQSKLPDNAWIGIIPSQAPHGSEAVNDQHDVAYQYLNGRTSGVLTFKAPAAGAWDFRLNSTDNNGQELASISFSVK